MLKWHKIIHFSLQIHCKTLNFEQCFYLILKYKLLFSWLNCNLPFKSKEHNKNTSKIQYLNTIGSKKHAKKLNIMHFLLHHHCKTLIFEECFQHVLRYEVLFSLLFSCSKKYSKDMTKNSQKSRILIQLVPIDMLKNP